MKIFLENNITSNSGLLKHFGCAYNRHKKIQFFRFFMFCNFGFFGQKKARFPALFFFHFFSFFQKKNWIFFEVFFAEKKNFSIFFKFFFVHFVSSFILQIQKTRVYVYPYFNMHFLPFQNSLFSHYKKRKIEMFVPIVCTSKNNLETTLWCYVVLQKNFHDFLIRSGYPKFCPKKISPKKRLYCRNFEKKKNWKIADFRRSAGIWIQYLGVHLWVLGGASVKKLNDLSFKCVLCASKVRFHYFETARYR